MTRLILTLNAGSSSLKFSVFEAGSDDPGLKASGQVDRIGEAPVMILKSPGQGRTEAGLKAVLGAEAHAAALGSVLEALRQTFPGSEVTAVGHRIVHGGAHRTEPVVLNDAILTELEALSPFAPLHQPHNLAGIHAARAAFPEALQVGCFDTAFHRGHPWVHDTFALPRAFYDEGVRRYGFHGLSYDYIAGYLAQHHPDLHAGRVVVAHLGNGASMCGIRGGKSIASTMGFSAADGLPMGTRTGQLDPGVMLYLMQQKGMSAGEISDLIYKKSGLLGLSGLSNDMRTLEASGTAEANEAIAYYCARIRRELGGLAAALGGIDALIFTGGIGENSRHVRTEVCQDMGWIGIHLDPSANSENREVVSTQDSSVRVMVIPTNEELVIARATTKAMATRTAAGKAAE